MRAGAESAVAASACTCALMARGVAVVVVVVVAGRLLMWLSSLDTFCRLMRTPIVEVGADVYVVAVLAVLADRGLLVVVAAVASGSGGGGGVVVVLVFDVSMSRAFAKAPLVTLLLCCSVGLLVEANFSSRYCLKSSLNVRLRPVTKRRRPTACFCIWNDIIYI